MKSTEEFYQQMRTAFAQRSGIEPDDSCDLAVRLYAAAAELQALSIQADWVLEQSFPQTAVGVYLERHAALRGLQRNAAVQAKGTLRFLVETAPTGDLSIPQGTVCMNAEGERFITTADTAVKAGALWAEAPAEAVNAGSAGNAAAGTVTILAACPVGITGCTNQTAFAGGSDEETDAALRTRLLETYQRLPNGANAAFYEQTAMSHSGVAAAKAVGRARGVGTVNVYIAAPDGTPTAELVEQVRADLAKKREISVDVQVLAPTTAEVPVTVEIAVRDGADGTQVKAAVAQAVGTFFSGGLLGKPVLLAELGRRIYDVEGVENYHLLAPTEDLEQSASVLPVLGNLSVKLMGED